MANSISSSKQRSVIKDYVTVVLKANIPLEQSNNMEEFMKKYCVDIGNEISNCKNFRRYYVPQIAEHLHAIITLKFATNVENKEIFTNKID